MPHNNKSPKRVQDLLTSRGFVLVRIGKHFIYRDGHGKQISVSRSPRDADVQFKSILSQIKSR